MKRIFEIYKNFWINCFNFKGNSTRSEYWLNFLINAVLICVLFVPGYFVNIIGYIVLVLYIAVIIPSLSICWRRLHDTGRSGLNFFWVFVPFFGVLYLIILLTDKTKLGKKTEKKDDNKSETI